MNAGHLWRRNSHLLQRAANEHGQQGTSSWPYITPRVEPVTSPICLPRRAFFDRIGVDLRTLNRRHGIINADVLDAWFPPAPGVIATLEENLEWILRTSPPTQCEGLIDAIAKARSVPQPCLVVGAGSSDLIFRAFPRWLSFRSSVLLLDPTYGEYQHVLEHVIGCRGPPPRSHRHGRISRESGGARRSIIRTRPDLVILVNPNNPTGQHIRRADLETIP